MIASPVRPPKPPPENLLNHPCENIIFALERLIGFPGVIMKNARLSIGSWAYCFGPYQANPVPFDTVIEKLGKLGFDGVELGGFPPHPSPASCDTKEKRAELKQKVSDRGLQFSGLAADLWSFPIIPLEDNSKWMAAFESNLEFASDLGIDCIRVDSVSPPDIFEKENVDPKLGWERLVSTFRTAAQKAADRGIRVVWEFEPGFAFNKPSEILRLVDDVGHRNLGVLFDTCHAHICASIGARQPGEKETLPGGALELLTRLKGKIGHIHLIDSDGKSAPQRNQHPCAIRAGRTRLRPADPADPALRLSLGLVDHRPLLLARCLGGDGGRKGLSGWHGAQVRGRIRPLAAVRPFPTRFNKSSRYFGSLGTLRLNESVSEQSEWQTPLTLE